MLVRAWVAMITVVTLWSTALPLAGAQSDDADNAPAAAHDAATAALVNQRAEAVATWRDARQHHARKTREVRRADDRAEALAEALAIAERDRENQRRLTGVYAVQSYLASGDTHPVLAPDQAQRGEMVAVMAEQQWREAQRRADEAADQSSQANASAAETRRQLDAARRQLDAAETTVHQVDSTIAATAGLAGIDLPPVAWAAYRTASHRAAANGCTVPAAVLAGMGHTATDHGRRPTGSTSLDGVVTWALTTPKGGSGPLALTDAHVDAARLVGWRGAVANIADSAEVAALLLCATGQNLTTWRGLAAAATAVYPDAVTVERALAVAHRYYAADPSLGEVPARPLRIGRGLSIDDSERLPDGDINAMLWWGLSRLGTPYSQCIGRPQDPVCPPGTNRYGDGFFDCSGFVAAAYARIGVAVPLTTYAMEADAAFMSTQVADRVNLSVMLPGDIMLMDGHVMLYLGQGKILHSSAGGVQVEPVPGYAWNEVFAILRPVPPRDTTPVPPAGPATNR